MRYLSSAAGRFVAADEALAELLGYDSADELIASVGDIATEFYADPASRTQLLDALAATGATERLVAPVRRKDGKVVWLAEWARTKHGHDGEPLIEGELADVTPLRRELETLRECKAGFRALVDHSADGALVAMDGRVRHANPALGAMLGAEPAALIGLPLSALVELPDPALASNTVACEFEGLLRHRDGAQRVPAAVKLASVVHGGGTARLLLARDLRPEREARAALVAAADSYRAIFENSVVGMCQSTPEGRFLNVNPAFAALLGYPSPAVLLREITHIPDMYAEPSERAGVLAKLDSAGRAELLELKLRRRDGSLIWVLESARAVRGADGRVSHYEGVVHDVTAKRAVEDALRSSEARYRALVEDSQVGVFMSEDGRIVYANRALATMLGRDEDDLQGVHFRAIYAPESVAAAEDRLAARARGATAAQHVETTLLRGDGLTRITVSIAVSTLEVEGRVLETGTVIDISTQKRVERELRHVAMHDPLTGLPNRAHFLDRLGRVLRSRRGAEAGFAVLFIDLDGFKVVNDSLGHARGDQLLVEVAERLRHCVRPGDTLSRHGGDEFTLLLEHVAEPEQAVAVAHRILDGLRRPLLLGDRELFAAASIGIALGHSEYASADEVLRDADTAMYQAKAAGSGSCAVFDAHMHDRARHRLTLETDLRAALERGEFRCYLQPIVDLQSGGLAGFEALLRWQHPERGLLAPGEFLTVAEETGTIVAIGWWMLGEAARAMAELRAQLPTLRHASVTVNLAQAQLLDPELPRRIVAALGAAKLPTSALRLEITETVLMESAVAARGALDALRELGVVLDLDDFGTGHSSLSYVGAVPVNGLKVDRSFLSGTPGDARRSSMLMTIAQLARNLGLEATVEGVETAAQARLVQRLGYRRAQGYLYSKPLPIDAATRFAADYRGRPRSWLDKLLRR
jgi:diguanylate cyclase (GGDEF)-like protein/PAS domain S-box-containing protein